MLPVKDKPMPEPGQWWRFGREEGVIVRLYPGGAGDMGIAEFRGNIPPAHVATMLRFDAWTPLKGPSVKALPAPCTCVTLDGGIILANGCALHDAANVATLTQTEPEMMSP